MSTRLNELAVVFVSIVLQSLPFVLIGVFVSALVQRYVSERMVARWLPKRPLAALLLASVFGFVAPVCDCGSIPLARRLAAKGVPPAAALTFLLAAPVVNPVVLLSTMVAFQGNWVVAALRMGMTLSVAVTVGLAASALFPRARIFAPSPLPVGGGAEPLSLASDGHEASAESARGPLEVAPERPRLAGLFADANAEFFDVIFFIILGALFTAGAQTIVPRGDLAALGADGVGSILTLMPLATLLSICSEADAFVARAFANTFSLGAVLAFMTIGQLVDLRNGALLLRTVGSRALLLIAVASYALTFLQALALNRVMPRL